jgi:hypothetical protein
MTTTASGGLVRIAGELEVAANEERAAGLLVDDDRRNDATAGWDPYQVWLTRVKAPREARDQPDSPAPAT